MDQLAHQLLQQDSNEFVKTTAKGASMSEAVAVAEMSAVKRSGVDRRKRPTPMLSRYTFLGGRRAGERRQDVSSEGLYVDKFNSSLLLMVIGIAIFNFFDCFFTLLQVGRGATELNPFVRVLLERSPELFIFTKSMGMGLILCFLCLHRNFKLARGTMIFALAMYFGIFVYHLVLYAWGL